ncbi:hypothetical protein T459_26078 [Capsicum annuum]|uniref:HMA domain-containing protein n=1 Tax=Capsicum annuum TaxID=4072 RepID=A0A2G2YMP7_CAPAN|nr:hypothetical protein FXO37_15186 [Capsicum annuum]PHT70974.1 hypothetical protein T459_26078 [Capsicum annuum]
MKTDAIIVLELDLHSEEYAREVEHSVLNFEGVEDMNADYSAGKLIVKGNIDAITATTLRDMVEGTTKKKVKLRSYECKFDGSSKKAARVHCGSSLFGCLKPKVVGRGHDRHHQHGHNHGHTSDSSSEG